MNFLKIILSFDGFVILLFKLYDWLFIIIHTYYYLLNSNYQCAAVKFQILLLILHYLLTECILFRYYLRLNPFSTSYFFFFITNKK